jgi:hypothetical protein
MEGIFREHPTLATTIEVMVAQSRPDTAAAYGEGTIHS